MLSKDEKYYLKEIADDFYGDAFVQEQHTCGVELFPEIGNSQNCLGCRKNSLSKEIYRFLNDFHFEPMRRLQEQIDEIFESPSR